MKNDIVPDIKDFKEFLSKTLLKTDILSIYQFKRGASSFNYRVHLRDKKILVKLAWKHKKEGVIRLIEIINTLSKSTFPIAKIIPINNQYFFKYKDSYGFLLEYVNGSSLPATKINETYISQILSAYKILQTINLKNKELLIKEYDFQKIQEIYLKNCNKIIQNKKKNPVVSLLFKLLKKELEKIGVSELKILPQKKKMIHGDFHHNNMLFKNKKLISILDFEDLGYGYISEDLIRFILCLTARYPLFVPKKKMIKNYISTIKKEFDISYDELMLGLNSFALQKMKKILSREKKITFKLLIKTIQIIFFMKQYDFLKNTFKELEN